MKRAGVVMAHTGMASGKREAEQITPRRNLLPVVICGGKRTRTIYNSALRWLTYHWDGIQRIWWNTLGRFARKCWQAWPENQCNYLQLTRKRNDMGHSKKLGWTDCWTTNWIIMYRSSCSDTGAGVLYIGHIGFFWVCFFLQRIQKTFWEFDLLNQPAQIEAKVTDEFCSKISWSFNFCPSIKEKKTYAEEKDGVHLARGESGTKGLPFSIQSILTFPVLLVRLLPW